ncbi:unnamed protein product [Chrysoparadoxa australica]
MILRVRSQVGQWRVHGVTRETTIAQLREQIGKEHNLDLSDGEAQPLSLKPNALGDQPALPLGKTLQELGLAHGDMLHLKLDEARMAHEEAQGPKKVNADGTIVQQSYDEVAKKTGFRPGMMSLRSMKMKWTLADFMEMDDHFTFKLKRQDKAVCTQVSLDTKTCQSFQTYLRQFNFHQCRMGYLYGYFEEDNKVKVECAYEPPQRGFAAGFELLDDPREEVVEQLAQLLGLRKVGWIFAHPPREEGFQFSSSEVLMAADLQLEAAQGVNDTPFVTVSVTANEDGTTHFGAFQMSNQCLEMVAEGVLDVGENPGACKVSDTFTAVVEAKGVKEVDNNFFLTLVPIVNHDSERFVNTFPQSNREGSAQTWSDVKRQLSKAGEKGFTYIDLLSDFHLLLFLTAFLDMKTDMPKICTSVVDREVPLDSGFELIISHMAGMDG